MHEVILVLFIFINFVTFFVYSVDKWFAIKQKQRISERELHTFALLGGFLGATLSMAIFKHKISKSSFLLKHIFIMLVWIVAIVYYFKAII